MKNKNNEIIIPETNKKWVSDDKFVYIDRIYGSIFNQDRLVLKDGTVYEGKIQKRSIKLEDGTLGHVYFANNKWFDRTGMPIDKPNNLVTRGDNDG